jgi:hypothetical protein
MDRPSTRSTVRASSVTVICVACAGRGSAGEKVIPGPQQEFDILLDYSADTANFHTAETATVVQAYRSKPEFGRVDVSFDMDVWRLAAISGVEIEAVWPAPQNRRHGRQSTRIGNKVELRERWRDDHGARHARTDDGARSPAPEHLQPGSAIIRR